MDSSVSTYLFTTLSAVTVSAVAALFIRQKTKSEIAKNVAETENIVVEKFNKLTKAQSEEIERLEGKVKDNSTLIKELEAANDECEFEHGLTRLQLEKALQKLQMFHWVKASVFVLDDSEIVVKVFTKWFERMPVVHFKPFTDPDTFLIAAKRERPDIVVLDYMLGDSQTAEDVIKQLGYEPAIFIMSATKEYEARFSGTDVLFFYKDKYYIRKISRAILDHLRSKNRHS